MLKVMLVGNIAADAEVRYTADGRQMVSFRVGVNSRRKNRDGEYEDHTDWIRVQSMRSADYLSSHATKGTKAVVIGNLQVDTYEGRDGDTRVSLDVWADEVTIHAKPASNGEARPAAASSSRSHQASAADDLEDMPF